MSKPWKYTIGIVALAIVVAGVAGSMMNFGSSLELAIENTNVITELEAMNLLWEEVVVVSIGPFVVVATPFQLAYVILTIGLAGFALLVCMASFLVHHWPAASRSLHLPT